MKINSNNIVRLALLTQFCLHTSIQYLMEFDILNQLLTSTVSDLFTNSSTITLQSKLKVRQLQGLIKQQNSSRKNSQSSLNDSIVSIGSQSNVRTSTLKQYKNVAEWMAQQAPKRLQQCMKKIGIKQGMLKSSKRAQLQQFIDSMTVETLANQKKRVKNDLRCYDNDFKTLFNRLPNHQEKQPFRPLYVYYKKLKQFLQKKGGQEMSQQRIQAEISKIKQQRKQLRIKIQTYQKQFQQSNNRRIRYVRDIQPIQMEYKKYKDLKVDLQKYEEMLGK